MDVTPPRAPRPGDPFSAAPPPTDAPRRPAPGRKVRRKKGRRFFMVLLVMGALSTVVSVVLLTQGRDITVWLYEDIIVPRQLPEALPLDYPRPEAQRLVRTLKDFFARGDTGAVPDATTIQMIARIQAAMADQYVSEEEAAGLLEAAQAAGARADMGDDADAH